MMTNLVVSPCPLLAALMLVLLAIGVSACGSGNPREVEEGEVVKVGKLKYTVIFSRYLNENDNEDVGLPEGPAADRRTNTTTSASSSR